MRCCSIKTKKCCRYSPTESSLSQKKSSAKASDSLTTPSTPKFATSATKLRNSKKSRSSSPTTTSSSRPTKLKPTCTSIYGGSSTRSESASSRWSSSPASDLTVDPRPKHRWVRRKKSRSHKWRRTSASKRSKSSGRAGPDTCTCSSTRRVCSS